MKTYLEVEAEALRRMADVADQWARAAEKRVNWEACPYPRTLRDEQEYLRDLRFIESCYLKLIPREPKLSAAEQRAQEAPKQP